MSESIKCPGTKKETKGAKNEHFKSAAGEIRGVVESDEKLAKEYGIDLETLERIPDLRHVFRRLLDIFCIIPNYQQEAIELSKVQKIAVDRAIDIILNVQDAISALHTSIGFFDKENPDTVLSQVLALRLILRGVFIKIDKDSRSKGDIPAYLLAIRDDC
jgi:hypothetical protein